MVMFIPRAIEGIISPIALIVTTPYYIIFKIILFIPENTEGSDPSGQGSDPVESCFHIHKA